MAPSKPEVILTEAPIEILATFQVLK